MRRNKQKKHVLHYIFGFLLMALAAFVPVIKNAGGMLEAYALLCQSIHGVPETVVESAIILPALMPSDTVAESAQIYNFIDVALLQEERSPDIDISEVEVAQGYAPEIVNHTKYKVEADSLFNTYVPALTLGDQPEILIVHTHSSESYTSDPENIYLPDDVMRTLDTKYNVVRVGDEICTLLENAGIAVVHDRDINDYPSYNGSYSQMLKKINKYISKYPSIKMVLDVHRDAIVDDANNNIAMRTTINGEDYAKLMYVVGTDAGGLSHTDWHKNLGFASTLQGYGEKLYPGLMRPIDLRKERFNQHTTPASLIIEIGSAGNTLKEALKSAGCFTQILLRTLGIQ